MKRLCRVFLCYILISQYFLLTVFAKPDWPSDTGVQAESGIVIDADSGAVLFGQNIHQAYPPASITKLLTALVVLEHASLSDTVTFSDDAVNNVEEGSGNKLNIAVGDQLSVEDCLYALLLVSSNQAANALAEHVAGSRDGFVQMMNDKIAEIGCIESNFRNPSGLNDDDQYVSAYDMALISMAAFSNEKLVEIDSTLTHKIPATSNNPDGLTLSMEHRLLKTTETDSPYYYPSAKAGKTGYTSKAGNTLVTYAEQDGRRLISVILKGSPSQYFVDGKELLIFGFNRFKNVNIAENETQYITGQEAFSVGDASYEPSELILSPDSVITLPNDAAFTDAEKNLITDLPDNAPEGAVGRVDYTYNDRKIGQAYLLLKTPPQTPDESSASAEADALTDPSQPEESLSADSRSFMDFDFSGFNLTGLKLPVWAVVLIVIFLILAAVIAYLVHSRKREARELALRRQKRMERLREDNISDLEFERLLEQRRQSLNKAHSQKPIEKDEDDSI